MFDLLVKAHGLLGHHITTGLFNEPGVAQNPSFVPMGPNEVSSRSRLQCTRQKKHAMHCSKQQRHGGGECSPHHIQLVCKHCQARTPCQRKGAGVALAPFEMPAGLQAAPCTLRSLRAAKR